MEEVSNPGEVLEDQVQAESATPQAESDQEAVSAVSTSQSESKPDQQDKSWVKKLRRDRDEAVRREQETARKAQIQEELIKQLVSNGRIAQPEAEEDIFQKVQKQEYVAGEDVAKLLKQQKDEFRRELDELKKHSAQQQMASMFTEIKREYSDFDEVVNPDTLALLDESDPSTAQARAEIKDPSKQARLAYKMIKANGLVEKVPDSRRAKEVEKKLEQNKKTVQAPQAYSPRPMAQAFRNPETKKEKEALWAETLKFANMSGGGY